MIITERKIKIVDNYPNPPINLHANCRQSSEPTNESEEQTEQQRQQNERSIPFMAVDHSGNTKVHKDDSFAHGSKHFHEVFNGSVRLLGNIPLHITLHSNATKRTAEIQRKRIQQTYFRIIVKNVAISVFSCKELQQHIHFTYCSLQ